MQYVDDRYRLHVEIRTKDCQLPTDERERLQRLLEPLGEAVRPFAGSRLVMNFVHHANNPQGGRYHVEAKVQLPGQTIFSADRDDYLDSALQRCLRKLVRGVQDYQEHPDRRAVRQAERLANFERDVVLPEDPDAGPLAEAVRAGDYRTFRNALIDYEDFLRLRVGRWVQRYPKAEARVGDGIKIGDLVEEVYLNAFERFGQRPTSIPLGEWLESLIDPSLKMLMRRPDEERENASFARTLRQAPA
jgi:ribosome-associated translation inhibitor RaiA